MQADNGSRAVAMIDGVVTFSGYQGGYGGTIVVKGTDGVYRRYAVHGQPLVGRGAQVRQGQPIGIIAKGHLHYEEIHPTLPDGRPNPVFQEFEKTGNGNTSYQRGTTNPAQSLNMRQGTPIVQGQPLNPESTQAAQERAAKKAEEAERLYKEWSELDKPEENPVPKRSRAGGINLKINIRGPRGVKVSSDSSGALSGATISREMDRERRHLRTFAGLNMGSIRDVHNVWRDNLVPASFRGAVFHVEASSRAGGRRTVVHEYPKRKTPILRTWVGRSCAGSSPAI